MSGRRRLTWALTTAILAGIGVTSTASAQTTDAALIWTPAPVPGVGQVLGSVSLGRAGTGWTVGWDQIDPASDYFGPAAYRLQNGTWLQAKQGLPINTRLDEVDADATGAIAVGEEMRYLPDGSPGYYHFAARWDGASWIKERVPQADGTEFYSRLQSVDALASGEAWAVGTMDSFEDENDRRGVLMHRTPAGQWQQVEDPLIREVGDPVGVLALSPNDLWITGRRYGGPETPSILHYDGTQWTKAVLPALPSGWSDLNRIAGRPNDLWAVGATRQSGDDGHSLALHFDGTSWVLVPNPVKSSQVTALVQQCGKVFAVGYRSGQPAPLDRRYQVLELKSAGVTELAAPPQTAAGILTALAADPAGKLWVVGAQDKPNKPGGNLPFAAQSQSLCP